MIEGTDMPAAEYVVLRRAPQSPEGWVELGVVTAANRKTAIRALTSDGNRTGTFVAVRTREWHPLTRDVAVREVDTWS